MIVLYPNLCNNQVCYIETALYILCHTFWKCTVNSRIFPNSVKTHICDVKFSRQGRDLLISVNDRLILPIREDYIFKKLRICEVSRK